MDAKERAEKIVRELLLENGRLPTANAGVEAKHIQWVAAQIEEEKREFVLQLAAKQAVIHGESVMLNGKLITNEELYKQPTDYIKDAYAEGFRAARDKAKGIAGSYIYEAKEWPSDEVGGHIAQRIGEMEP